MVRCLKALFIVFGFAVSDDILADSLASDDLPGLQLLQMQVKTRKMRPEKESVVIHQLEETNAQDANREFVEGTQSEALLTDNNAKESEDVEDSTTQNEPSTVGQHATHDEVQDEMSSVVQNATQGYAQDDISTVLQNTTQDNAEQSSVDEDLKAQNETTEAVSQNYTISVSLKKAAQDEQRNQGKSVIQSGLIHKLKPLSTGKELIVKMTSQAKETAKVSLLSGGDVPLRVVLGWNKQFMSINSRESGMWGHKERHLLSLREGKEAEVRIYCGRKAFRVFVNGEKFAHYRFHIPLSSIKGFLVEGNVRISAVQLKESQLNKLSKQDTLMGSCPASAGMNGCVSDRHADRSQRHHRRKGRM